jgi:hypothetical protein
MTLPRAHPSYDMRSLPLQFVGPSKGLVMALGCADGGQHNSCSVLFSRVEP